MPLSSLISVIRKAVHKRHSIHSEDQFTMKYMLASSYGRDDIIDTDFLTHTSVPSKGRSYL